MARKKKAPEAPQPILVKGFKGFDKDLRCRDKQYALGESFEEQNAVLCEEGMHFCEHPLDCFGYYAPGLGSRYAEVTAEDPSDQNDSDSKRVTKKLSVGGELSIHGLVEAAVSITFERATWSDYDKAKCRAQRVTAPEYPLIATISLPTCCGSISAGRGTDFLGRKAPDRSLDGS